MECKDTKTVSFVQAVMSILSCLVILSAVMFVRSPLGVSPSDRDTLVVAVQSSAATRHLTGIGASSSARGIVPEAKSIFSEGAGNASGSLVGQSASDGGIEAEPDNDSTLSPVKETHLASSSGTVWEKKISSSLPQTELPSEQVESERAMPLVNQAILADGVSAPGLKVARAEEVPDIPGNRPSDVQESPLLAAGEVKAANPQTQKVTAQIAVDGLVRAFIAEREPEGKQDILAAAAELSVAEDISMRPILDQALLAHQPLKVRQQALYLAADVSPELVRKIAADSAHPLHQEAEAFLLEARLP